MSGTDNDIDRQWRIQGGGPGGPDPPLLGHNVGFLTLGPKVGPPPFVNVQEWGCFSIFLMADDVTQTMSKGGVLVNVQEWGCFSNFLRSDDVTRTMSKGGVLVKNPVSAPGPPPFKNPGSAPDRPIVIGYNYNVRPIISIRLYFLVN